MNTTSPRSRLDVGQFTAAEIQTMARHVGVPVEIARRLVECAVTMGKLPRRSRKARAALATVESPEREGGE